MAADIYMNQTMAAMPPPTIESKMRFDPNKRLLSSLINEVIYTVGNPDAHEKPAAIRFAVIVTSANQAYILEGADKIIQAYGTAVKLENALWRQLPTIADYVDLDTLYDVDDVQSAFYDATKHQGW